MEDDEHLHAIEIEQNSTQNSHQDLEIKVPIIETIDQGIKVEVTATKVELLENQTIGANSNKTNKLENNLGKEEHSTHLKRKKVEARSKKKGNPRICGKEKPKATLVKGSIRPLGVHEVPTWSKHLNISLCDPFEPFRGSRVEDKFHGLAFKAGAKGEEPPQPLKQRGKPRRHEQARKLKTHEQQNKRKLFCFLDCPLCNKLLEFAVETRCGHVFCSQCIQEKLVLSKLCPVCETEVCYLHPSYVLRELIHRYQEKDGPKKLRTQIFEKSKDSDDADDDPIIVSSQFSSEQTGGCCSQGIFDATDLYKTARLDEFVSLEDFLDTFMMVNRILSRTSPRRCMERWLSCCLMSTQARIVQTIEAVLDGQNIRWPMTGLFWTLMHLDGGTELDNPLGEKLFLTLRIDPTKARAYQTTLDGQKRNVKAGGLQKENARMRLKMIELGQNNLLHSTVGCDVKDSKEGRVDLSKAPQRGLTFAECYPDHHIVSSCTLKDLAHYDPESRKYLLPPWSRVRSKYSDPLSLNEADAGGVHAPSKQTWNPSSKVTSPEPKKQTSPKSPSRALSPIVTSPNRAMSPGRDNLTSSRPTSPKPQNAVLSRPKSPKLKNFVLSRPTSPKPNSGGPICPTIETVIRYKGRSLIIKSPPRHKNKV